MLIIIQSALLLISLSISSVVYADTPIEAIKTIEQQYHGRVGVSAINMATQQRFDYRANERFPMCSTYKWVVSALVLSHIQENPALAEKHIYYKKAELVGYPPETSKNVATGMMIEALAQAVILSDNTAANLLITQVGGSESLTDFARIHGG